MGKRESRQINIGNVPVGGGAPVSIQSMTNTDTRDATATIHQISELALAGAEIVRIGVQDMDAVAALPEIISGSAVPLVADIHFDYKLGLASIKAGIHALRINPGNIGGDDKVKQIAEAAGEAGIPIRIGVNSGSLPQKIFGEKLKITSSLDDALFETMVASGLEECERLERFGFRDIKVSLKAPAVPVTVAAYRKFAAVTDYPLHLGITEAGTLYRGTIKSAIGIGALLLDGIGDSIRVSLTADPVEEVKVGIAILESSGARPPKYEIISCPTCTRTSINLFALVSKVEILIDEIETSGLEIPVRKIAVMGCAVNGPGEARHADVGIAGAKDGQAVVFKRGEVMGVYPEEESLEVMRQILLSW